MRCIYQKLKLIFQKRIIPVLTAFMVLISALVVSAPSASAAVIDLNDYILNIEVDGDNDIITLELPLPDTYSLIVNHDYDNLYNLDYGLTYDFNNYFTTSDHVNFRMFLCEDLIRIRDIPLGSTIHADFTFTNNFPFGYTCTNQAQTHFYDSRYIWIGTSSIDRGSVYLNGSFSVDFPYSNVPSDSVYLICSSVFTNFEFPSVPVGSITFDKCYFKISISSLYRLQQEVGETNEILEAVKAELIAQGTTLDDVLVKLGVIEANQRDILSTLVLISTNLWEWFSQTWTKLDTGFQSVVNAVSNTVGNTLNGISQNVQNIFTGGSAGEELEDKTDEMIDSNNQLNDAVDRFDQANASKPTVPDNIASVIDPVAIDDSVTFLTGVFNYEAMGLDALFPMLALVAGLAVLMYVLFGKSGG